MIKFIIFDLDGVSIDTPDMHYETFQRCITHNQCYKNMMLSLMTKAHRQNKNH